MNRSPRYEVAPATPGHGLLAPAEPACDSKTYCNVATEGAVACLAVYRTAWVADYEGLVWRDGRVLFEISGSVRIRDESLECALRTALAARLHRP